MVVWYMPVIIAEREGEHTGAVMKACRKRVPSLASWSTLGVWMAVSP